MLPTEHLRIYRRGETLRPIYLDDETSLAKTLIAVYSDHVGRRRGELLESLANCEELGYDYKLVRGLASVLDTRASFAVEASVPSLEARSEVFKEAGPHVVASERERLEILRKVADRLSVEVAQLEDSLYADLEEEHRVAEFRAPAPEELNRFYNYAQTVALLAYSRGITVFTSRGDDYLESLAAALGEVEKMTSQGTSILSISLKPTSRIAVRGSKMDEFVGRLLKAERWTLEAVIHYPSTSKRKGVMSLSSDAHGGLLERDETVMETLIEVEPRIRKPRFGDIIVLEDLAARNGVTEDSLLRKIRDEGFDYIDLGGVLVSREKLKELNESIMRVETLGGAKAVLRGHGVANIMAVLEALGYAVEWRKPMDESRLYHL